MKSFKRASLSLTVAVLALGLSGCMAVKIKHNVRNPGKYFDRAYSRIESIHRSDPMRRGKADKVHVLVYDISGRELIQVAAPFWLVDTCMDIDGDEGRDRDLGLEERYEFDRSIIRDLKKVGPGLLAEVEDGENRVLVWIE